MTPDIDPADWAWLKDRLADYQAATGTARESVLADARKFRPDLAAMLGDLIVDYKVAETRTIPASFFGSQESGAFSQPEPPPPTFSAGDIVSGRYLVEEFVGRGGMGEVYRVLDQTLPARGSIALKTIRSDMAGSREAATRFEREIRNSLAVAHPNVCRMYDVGRHNGKYASTLHLTMEFLPGLTLARYLKERDVRAHPVPLREALPVVRQMAAGLAAIHTAGIVHRDFKPANVILVPEGEGEDEGVRPVITDFGLSRADGQDQGATETGLAVGTLAWMAPELISGHGVSTPAVDVYAYGVTVYEMLTGLRYAPGAPVAGLEKAGPLREIVRRCLEHQPSKRFADAAALVAALDAPPAAKPIASRRAFWTGVAAILLCLAALAFLKWRDAPLERSPAERALLDKGFAEFSAESNYEASLSFEKAVALAPHDAFAHALLASAYNRLELSARADREFLKATEADDLRHASSDERLFIDGAHLIMARDYPGAARSFQRYYDNSDASSKPQRALLLGRALQLAQKPAEALRAYESARNLPAAMLWLGILDARALQTRKSDSEFEAAIAGFRASGQTAALAAAWRQYGNALNVSTRFPEARATLNACIRQAASTGDEYDATECRRLLDSAAISEARTESDLAAVRKDLLELVSRRDTQDYGLFYCRAYIMLGQIDVRIRDFPAADADFRDAVRWAERDGSTRLRAEIDKELADLHNRTGRAPDAEQEARRALAFFETDHSDAEAAPALVALGQSLRNQGRLAEALRTLEAGLPRMQGLSDAARFQLRFAIASVYAALEDAPAAVNKFSEVLSAGTSGNEVFALMALGQAQVRVGDFAAARKTAARIAEENLTRHFQSSLRQLNALIELSAGSPAGAAAIARPDGEAPEMATLGLARIRMGGIGEGLELCRKSLKTGTWSTFESLPRLCILEGLVTQNNSNAALGLYHSIGSDWKPQLESTWKADSLMQELDSSHNVFRAAADKHLEDLRHVWGDAAFWRYLSRPDVEKLTAATGLSQDFGWSNRR